MLPGIRVSFFATIFAIAILTAGSTWLLSHYHLPQQVRQYQDQQQLQFLLTQLHSIYQQTGSWQFLQNDATYWHALEAVAGNRQPALYDGGQQLLLGTAIPDTQRSMHAIGDSTTPAGYLALDSNNTPLTTISRQLIHQQWLYGGLAALLALAIATLILLPLSARMSNPIQKLLAATRKLTAGTFSTRLPENSHNEMGQLAADFNLLAKTLESNENARNQWIADISHELRTPLAVLRAQLEALLDGVRQPDMAQLRLLHNKTGELERLVDNLYQLSLSDLGAITYRKETLAVTDLLNEAVNAFRPSFKQAGIELTVSTNLPDNTEIYADNKRLMQLFNNLLNNSLRYTEAPGKLIINAYCGNNSVTITLDDSAPGVDTDAPARLFERLYRVEPSRNRSLGGSGLGLSICKNIIDAHNGSIEASQSALGGLSITVILPLEKRRKTTRG